METKNIIEFPLKKRQVDKHHLHTINRGDANMSQKDKPLPPKSPIVKIELINYSSDRKDEYSAKFMKPLINGLLKRNQIAQAK
ncbi:hypothetical protein [Anaerospora hongkongensis]|uniref:hypothetical protein n=1 Tax=Anaerospora hongkongensis TaxID=244830 RepID=UPI002FDAB2D4